MNQPNYVNYRIIWIEDQAITDTIHAVINYYISVIWRAEILWQQGTGQTAGSSAP